MTKFFSSSSAITYKPVFGRLELIERGNCSKDFGGKNESWNVAREEIIKKESYEHFNIYYTIFFFNFYLLIFPFHNLMVSKIIIGPM